MEIDNGIVRFHYTGKRLSLKKTVQDGAKSKQTNKQKPKDRTILESLPCKESDFNFATRKITLCNGDFPLTQKLRKMTVFTANVYYIRCWVT